MNRTHLIFLHGALGCQLHWHKISAYFEKDFIVHTPDFPGHGESPIALAEPNYSALASWLKEYLESHAIKEYGIIGYSMGGYIGLKHLLDDTNSACKFLITLATKLNWNTEIANKEASQLSLESLNPIIDKLKKEQFTPIDKLIQNTQLILKSIGEQPIESRQFDGNKTPIWMLLGSKDRMVSEAEIVDFQTNHTTMQFEIIENQPHLLERMDAEVIAEKFNQILKTLIN